MSLQTIRDAYKARLLTVAGIGKVNDFEPDARREEDFKTYFVDGALGYMLGWSITREATAEIAASTLQNLAQYLIVVRGYRALQTGGSTEKAFQDLIESVRTALRVAQRDSFGLADVVVGPPPRKPIQIGCGSIQMNSPLR